MTAQEVAAIIEAWAPLSIQEEWDNTGFCVGSPQACVKGVITCLDVTPSVMEEAIALGANMIISHHPLIYNELKQLCEQDEVARMVAMAIRNNLVVYSAHTNADKAVAGVSWLMADVLNLQDIEILNPDKQSESKAPCGMGIIGNLPVPQEVHPFLKTVVQKFSLFCIKTSRITVPVIRRVAACGGSGSALIPKALERGADIFLSGDISYHHFSCADGKMIIADIGHYESEIGIVSKLTQLLSKKNLNFAVSISKNSSNPINYF